MSHPVNRLDRFQKGIYKSIKRVSNFYTHMQKEERIFYFNKSAPRYRNVTKKCSRICCGNRRKFFGELTLQEIRYGSGEIYPD
jgi:hypothetical protein